MMIKNYDNFISTPGLIIDGRSITQVLYIYSILERHFCKKDTVLIWKGTKSDLFFLSRIIKIPKKTYVFNINSQDQALFLNFKVLGNLKALLKDLKNKCSDYSICSCYASGFYFEVIKEFLKIQNENVIQFDDGLINEYVIKRKYRIFRLIINLIHGFIFLPSKYILFSDIKYSLVFTSLNPSNIISYSNKRIVNIAPNVKYLFGKISSRYINISNQNSVLFMTTHLVETGRMEKKEYQEFISKIFLKIKALGFQKIYLSKHPSEKHVNDRFYRNLGLDFSYTNFPSEIIIYNKNIRAVVNPLNSTLFLAKSLDLLKNIKIVASYVPLNSPLVASRVSKINELLDQEKITHHLVTFHE
jgi:hypothetical protein